jgi:hypothetical protein
MFAWQVGAMYSWGLVMTVLCKANGCSTPAQAMAMMCASHWRMLPAALRRTLRRSQQECGGTERDPALLPYLDACAQAVEFVAMQEMREPDNHYRQALAVLEADFRESAGRDFVEH